MNRKFDQFLRLLFNPQYYCEPAQFSKTTLEFRNFSWNLSFLLKMTSLKKTRNSNSDFEHFAGLHKHLGPKTYLTEIT